MKDFFDEDFPLSKKQEEELNRLAATPKTLEEPVVDEDTNPNPPAYDPQDDAFSYIDLEEDEPIDEAFSYTPPEEEAAEEIAEEEEQETSENVVEPVYEAEETLVEENVEEEPVEEVTEAPALEVSDEDSPETLAFDYFDEPVTEEKPEEEADEAKVPAVSHDEYLARLRQMNEIEEQLQREIKSLGEQLDNVEMKVDSLPDEAEEEEEPADFSYEYDERYFAEEETPAYKHPELYKKPAKAKPKAKRKASNKKGELTVNLKTLVGVGAAVAAAIAAAKLLGGDDKK